MRQATLPFCALHSKSDRTRKGINDSEIVPNPSSFGTFHFPLLPARAQAHSQHSHRAAYRRPLAELGRPLAELALQRAPLPALPGWLECAEIAASMVEFPLSGRHRPLLVLTPYITVLNYPETATAREKDDAPEVELPNAVHRRS